MKTTNEIINDMKTPKEIIEKISELQSLLEREVEWSLTDYVESSEINPALRQINAGMLQLQIIAEEIEKDLEES